MRVIVRNNTSLFLTLLILGVLSTLLLDLWVADEVKRGTWIEEFFLWIAFFFRIVAYAVLFVSCRLIAEELPLGTKRTFLLGMIWALVALSLAALIWWHLAFSEEIHNGGAIRFTPDRPSLPDWLAEAVVVGNNYTWWSVITRESIGLISTSFLTAYFLAYMAKTGRMNATYFAPFVSYLCLTFYSFILSPWSFTWGPTPWIGDALLGAMAYNGFFIIDTLFFGGLTGPAIWINLIAIANLALIISWSGKKAG